MENYFDTNQIQEIQEALNWAIQAHDGQVRKYEGVPYITHPMAVAEDLASKYQDKELVLAALLHDIVEDCDATFQQVYERYGKAVGYMVEAVSKEPLFFIDEPDVVYGDKIEKLLAGGMNDVRVLLLKIADRDHNLKTLEGLKPNKQIRMTFETQAIYEPLKDRIQEKSVKESMKNLQKLIKIEKIDSVKGLKLCLLNNTFNFFDIDTFNLAYKNTDKIIWQVESLSWFKELMQQEGFKNNTIIHSLETDGETFKAKFSFRKGSLIKNQNNQKLHAYNFITS